MMRLRDFLIVLVNIGLGLFFLVAGIGKLLMKSDAFSPMTVTPPGYLPPNVWEFVHFIVPFAEITVGALLVAMVAVRFTAAVSALLVAGFITTNLYMINSGLGDDKCVTCLGVFGSLSPHIALTLDTLMAIMIILVVLFYPANFFEMRPWWWPLAPVHKPDGAPSLGVPQAGEICKS